MRIVALWTWALPGTLVGLVLALVGGPQGGFWHRGVLWVRVSRIIPRWAAAQTWGGVVLTRYEKSPLAMLRHEDRHATQWAILGVLFMLAYPLASLVASLKGAHYYHGNWFEVDASRHE